jgi:hypothetical protein
MARTSVEGEDVGMDPMGTVMIAIGAFALLQVVAFNLRGEERHRRPVRTERHIRQVR